MKAKRIKPRAKAAPTTITVPALAKGEHYAGIILDESGKPSHHVVLLHGDVKLSWAAAGEWAKKQGGELPTRNEQSLLFANLAGKFERTWYWSAAQYADAAASAWYQYFCSGTQGWDRKDNELRARAVRRVPIR